MAGAFSSALRSSDFGLPEDRLLAQAVRCFQDICVVEMFLFDDCIRQEVYTL